MDLDWKELLGSLQSLVSRNACQVSVGQGGDGSIPMGMLSTFQKQVTGVSNQDRTGARMDTMRY